MNNSILLLLILMVCSSLGDIYVKYPEYLRKEFKDANDQIGNIEHSISTFGFFDYQSKTAMVLKLWEDGDGCSAPSSEMMVENPDQMVAYIMKRGGCTYFNKAQHVYEAGGSLTIVALNDEEEDPENLIPIGPKDQTELIPPLIIIKKQEADVLFQQLKTGQKIILHVDFDMKKYDGTLKVKTWLAVGLPLSYTFIADFLKSYQTFGKHINMNVVYPLYDASEINPDSSESWRSKHCFLESKYCVDHSANYLTMPTDAVKEGVAQHCILQRGLAEKRTEELSEYFQRVGELCVQTEKYDILECTKNLRKDEGDFIMSESELNFCVARNLAHVETIAMEGSEIPFLTSQQEEGKYFFYKSIPSIFIEDELVRGVSDGELAAGAICDSMRYPPLSCKALHLQSVKRIHKLLKEARRRLRSGHKWAAFFLFVGCFILFLFSLRCYKRFMAVQIENDLEKRINMGLENYHRVRDSEGDSVSTLPDNIAAEKQNTSEISL